VPTAQTGSVAVDTSSALRDYGSGLEADPGRHGPSIGVGQRQFGDEYQSPAVDHVRKLDVILSIKRAGDGELGFPTREPCFGRLFSVECLHLTVNNLALTFE
jgi:hypothetical protein